MRSLGGREECSRCHGAGCYYCQHRGYLLRCPACGDIDYQKEQPDHYECTACGTIYSHSGDIKVNEVEHLSL